jgi:DNA ligase (NAD+)
LRREIRQHDRLYYELDRPVISDAAYDRLFAELRQLERTYPSLATPGSPTTRVAGAPVTGFPPVRHLAPMLSLESVTDPAAVAAFDARMRRSTAGRWRGYLAEPKLDGLSVEVVYREGQLIRASTRGDGEVGEGVTANVQSMSAVPARLRSRSTPAPPLVAVRGEVMMRRDDFQRLNARLERRGQTPFANPRNAAAGSLRQLNPRTTASRRLDVFFYDILELQGGPRLTDATDVRRALSAWGLPTCPYARRCLAADDAIAYQRDMARRRDSLDFEVDGIVIKVTDLRAREQLGTTARHPRWALAFKFAQAAAESTIRDIVVQVGRTGVLTPVARLDPIPIGGVTVSRATLHNRDEIARKDLRIGDRVRVVRAGDVIPEILERVPRSRGRRAAPFRMPRRCPACRAPVVHEGPFDRCSNGLGCPAQLVRALTHLASREALDIRGLGISTAEALVEAGLVRSVADVFALHAETLTSRAHLGQVVSANLIAAIDRARHTTLSRFLYALGIPGIGAQTARLLADHFGTLEAVRAASERDCRAVPGLGPIAARDVWSFLRTPAVRRTIDACLRHGLRPASARPVRLRSPLAGKAVVFTGALTSMTRAQAETRARELGAQTSSAVGPHTDLVVAGARPGAKYARARQRGIRVIDERRFRQYVGRLGSRGASGGA